ncbi:hypothetical protein SM0020_24373 [Sinorhizobium meliloti CCNWSX0020]|uniref:Uncharacterized protein n=1 Tax=Sinorhizobium meliloti CCNWSX0020 TaxID=1107881 RepID=H0G5V9_RHIML|nr:hypothetical protein SM0020_24373 [Sinorhizobium meliloti CCNWSX0020]
MGASRSTTISGAQQCDETIKAGACNRSAGRASEVVVDDLNVAEAALSRDVNKIILPSLAFQIGHDLRLSGLPLPCARVALPELSQCWSSLSSSTTRPAACISRQASVDVACLRSLALSPSSVRVLNIRSSYRPDAGTSVLRDLIIFLLSDSTSTSEECRLVAACDQPVKLDQRRKIHACQTHRHAGAHHRINHPSGNRNHDTCRP